jgi:hypothetical protein
MSTQSQRFASCVKKVTNNFRSASLKKQSATNNVSKRSASFSQKDKEGIAIAICTKSILWPQGRTLKHFSMKRGKPLLITQKRKIGGKSMRSKK